MVYPNLISLEVSEADVLSRAADEQASRLRPSDATAVTDKLKPEVMMMLCLLLSACNFVQEIFVMSYSHTAQCEGSGMSACKQWRR